MSGIPELGSRISLISKADIRYEGRLFTVNPEECTIALSNVRSYGTENRETQFAVAPQNQIYEYILFRGSDIKDIRVVDNPVANDPAIMQMHLPPMQPFHNPHFPVPVMGHMGQSMGQFGVPGAAYAGMGGLNNSNLAPGSMPTNGLNNSKQSTSVLEMFGGVSRSTTPTSLNSRKSPSHDIGVQANQSNNSGRDRRNNRNRSQQRERKDSAQNEGSISQSDKNQQRNQQFHGNNQNRGWNANNRGNNNQIRGNRPRGRGQPMQQQAFRQNSQNNKARAKTIKFEGDYDFEQANNQFEELRQKVAKLKVGEEASSEQVNGEVDKKDDSGNETGAGEHELEEDDVTVGYDKKKSFFDNISCEAATDRTKGKNRTDWRHERKINSETFGVSARRGGFYNYRGRGGYFNRNTTNGGVQYRGNMGYNRGGNYRGRNFNNRNFNSSSTGIPQQASKDKPAAIATPATSEAAATAAN